MCQVLDQRGGMADARCLGLYRAADFSQLHKAALYGKPTAIAEEHEGSRLLNAAARILGRLQRSTILLSGGVLVTVAYRGIGRSLNQVVSGTDAPILQHDVARETGTQITLTGLQSRHPVRCDYTAFILKYVDTFSYRF